MSSIDAVVFDIGNVLIEWDRDRLYGRLIPDETERREFFENVMTMEVNLALDAGAPFGPTLATLAEEHPHLATEIVAFEHCWSETLGPQDDAMISLVRELLANGVGVFALTNFSHETWPIAVARCPWLGELDGIVVSGQEGVIKPDREIYNILLSRYRLDPARTWYADDSATNVAGAAAVGMNAVLYTDAQTTRAALTALDLLGPSAQ